ncbi:hypothetical protein KAI65_01285 [Candidatus Parcubacteria bacterium]|nr:hypothetical protein [Candidatus Parcubacteria bacterium]
MEKNNYKQKLESLITNSDLDKNDKGLWSLFIAIAPPEEDEAVFEAVSESDDNLNLLTNHLQGKIFSMQNINKDSWEKLVENKAKFSSFLKSLY